MTWSHCTKENTLINDIISWQPWTWSRTAVCPREFKDTLSSYDRTNETRRLAVVLVGDLFEVAMPVCKYLQASCTSASKVDITTFESLYIDRPHASCLPSTYSMIAFFRLVQQFSTRRIFDERSVEEVCNC